MTLYSVMAHRWGATNNHSYEVGVYADRAQALDVAERACDERAGKYGVVVKRWTTGDFGTVEAYFPSMAKEEGPYECAFRAEDEQLGAAVRSAVVNQHIRIADPREELPNIPVIVDVPAWLHDLVLDALTSAHYSHLADLDRKVHPWATAGEPLARAEMRELSRQRSERIEPLVHAAVEQDLARGRSLRQHAVNQLHDIETARGQVVASSGSAPSAVD